MKKPRTPPNKSLLDICDTIKRYQRFLILTHLKPDGDAVGSQLALLLALRNAGKYATAVSDEVPEQYRFLAGCDSLVPHKVFGGGEEFDACFVLDSSNPSRAVVDRIPKDTLIINIDHHIDNSLFGDINYVGPEVSAVGILIYDLLKKAALEISPAIAENLFAAIITDTGRFGFSNTDARTFRVISELVEHGASPQKITDEIYKNYSFRRALIFSRALSTIESHAEGRVLTMELPYKVIEKLNIRESETDGLVEYLQGIKGQEAAIMLKEFTVGEVRISLRSKGHVNVLKIAEKYGGGGHLCASGCTIINPLDEAKRKLIENCKEQIPGGIK